VLTLIASLAFMSAVQALLYLDLRVRREGLDLWLRPVLRPAVAQPPHLAQQPPLQQPQQPQYPSGPAW
jgi:hypothetical protein